MLVFILCINLTRKTPLKLVQQERVAAKASAKLPTHLSKNKVFELVTLESKLIQSKENVSSIEQSFISNLFTHFGEAFINGELVSTNTTLPSDVVNNALPDQAAVKIFQDLNVESFICPESYPVALDYKLYLNESWLTGRGYRNACAFSGGHQAFGDLLYGSNQWQNYTGNYADLTAFIPWDTVEGCKEDNFLIPLAKALTVESVSTLVNQSTGETIGFQVESIGLHQLNNHCLSYCQNLLDTYCAKLPPDTYYCQNTLSAAYYRESKYNVRNLKERYCVCKLKSDVEGYGVSYFNQVIDINSVMSYTAKLKSVSCTK